ncbi:hypothetical protein CONLIGDRAFT_638324 [Coniochaeta ligniaria NRRL 30616]|uniref:Ubiquitin-like protease family profile domain-containing protein n=1 Tax=Coniochaeta ligniaria NRRL 30616 TaxID=1408157 RepID=A0A1J7IXX8_9PEZI|nr:hypothetical protein CONLIGDRAFT_638324 [Coniochaeta ligniaria NRRL 30616]
MAPHLRHSSSSSLAATVAARASTPPGTDSDASNGVTPRRRSVRTAAKTNATNRSSPMPGSTGTITKEELAALIDALKRADSDHRACVAFRAKWRNLIRGYCARSTGDQFNFPSWALARLGPDIVLKCLRGEFGDKALDDSYRDKSSKSTIVKLARRFQLTDVRLLALWFGVGDDEIDTRFPCRKTWLELHSLLCSDDSDEGHEANRFFTEDYPKVMRSWAERNSLDPETFEGRKRSVMARQPYQDGGAYTRLKPRDLACIRIRVNANHAQVTGDEGMSAEDKDEKEAEEDGDEIEVEGEEEEAEEDGDEIEVEEEEEEAEQEEEEAEEEEEEDGADQHTDKHIDNGKKNAKAPSLFPPPRTCFSQPPVTRSTSEGHKSSEEQDKITVDTLTDSKMAGPVAMTVPTTASDPKPTTNVGVGAKDAETVFRDGIPRDESPPRQFKCIRQLAGLTPFTPSAPVTPLTPVITSTVLSQNSTIFTSTEPETTNKFIRQVAGSTPVTPSTVLSQNSTIFTSRELDTTTMTLMSADGPGRQNDHDAATSRKRSSSLGFETPTTKRLRPDQMIPVSSGPSSSAPAPAGMPAVKTGPMASTAYMVAPPGCPGSPVTKTAISLDGANEEVNPSNGPSAIGNELSDPNKWLSGATVSWFLIMITSCTRTIGDLDLPLDVDDATLTKARQTIARKAVDAGALGLTQLISGINHGQHWMLIVLRGVEVLGLYDSIDSEPTKTRAVLDKVRNLLPQRTATEHEVEIYRCPKQNDIVNCGVHTIVVAMFMATETLIPQSLNIRLWRLLLVAMNNKIALSSALSQDLVRFAVAEDEVDASLRTPTLEPLPSTVMTIPIIDTWLDQITAMARSAHEMASHSVAWYSQRRENVATVLAWVTVEAQPVLSRLVDCAAEVLDTFDDKQAAILRGRAMLEDFVDKLNNGDPEIVGCRNTLASARDDLQQSARLERALQQKCERAKDTKTVIEGLCLPQLEKQLCQTVQEYEMHVVWASGVLVRLTKPLVSPQGQGA